MKSSKKQKILAVMLAASLVAGTATALSLTVSAENTIAVTSENGGLVDAIDLKTDGTIYDGTISSFEDYQYYKVVIEEDGAFTVKFTNSNPNLDATLKSELYNEDFSVQYDSIENRTDGTPKTESHTYYLYKGTYYLKVFGYENYGNDKIDEPTAYKINGTFKSANSNVNTPNESLDKAMEIKIDTKYNSIIEEQQPYYWYKFEVNKKAKYTFVNTSQITYMNYRFTDKDQVILHDKTMYSPADTYEIELDKGTYFIEISGGTIQSAGMYTFYYYETAKGDPFVHEHSYSKDWKYDSESHWHECSCGEKADIAKHDIETVIDKEATTTEEGSKHDECTICGYKGESQIIPIKEDSNQESSQESSQNSSKEPISEPSEPVSVPSNPSDVPSKEPSVVSNTGKPAETGKGVSTGDSSMPITIASVLGLGAITAFVISFKKKHS